MGTIDVDGLVLICIKLADAVGDLPDIDIERSFQVTDVEAFVRRGIPELTLRADIEEEMAIGLLQLLAEIIPEDRSEQVVVVLVLRRDGMQRYEAEEDEQCFAHKNGLWIFLAICIKSNE